MGPTEMWEKAASAFSAYDVVILGDGLEFPDQESGRHPPGDPEEHQKTLRIIAAARDTQPRDAFLWLPLLGRDSISQGRKNISDARTIGRTRAPVEAHGGGGHFSG